MNADEYISEFKHIIAGLGNVLKQKQIEISQEKQIDIALGIFQTAAKDRRGEIANNKRNGNEPATKKQIDLLKNLGIEFEKEITKEQATKKISETIEDRKNGKVKK